MPIENRTLSVGTRLVAKYKKEQHVCTVVAAPEGEGVLFELADGKTFKSPSAAASAVMNGNAANGWRFWSVAAEGSEAPVTDALLAAAGKPKRKSGGRKKASPLFRRLPDTGLEEGQHRIWCSACQDGFISDTETPEACPNGHRADDPDLNAAPTEAEQQAEAEADAEPAGVA